MHGVPEVAMRLRAASIRNRDAGPAPSKVSNRLTNIENPLGATESTRMHLAISHSSIPSRHLLRSRRLARVAESYFRGPHIRGLPLNRRQRQSLKSKGLYPELRVPRATTTICG